MDKSKISPTMPGGSLWKNNMEIHLYINSSSGYTQHLTTMISINRQLEDSG